jgi:hypothetical protein
MFSLAVNKGFILRKKTYLAVNNDLSGRKYYMGFPAVS